MTESVFNARAYEQNFSAVKRPSEPVRADCAKLPPEAIVWRQPEHAHFAGTNFCCWERSGERRCPAARYVLVDDKPRLAAAVKSVWG